VNETRYQTALVVGFGESGEAAASLLLSEGTAVTVTDRDTGPEMKEKAGRLEQSGARVLLGPGAVNDLPWGQPQAPFDVAVVSPGVPGDSELVARLEGKGVPVISELELGASRCACPMLAITGTNGKSTMAKLCGESLAAAGRRVSVAGNYGRALCRLAAESGNLDWLVVEVSTFQLEKIRSFRPRIGVVLNIQPNHLDRHGSLDAYAALKMRMFEHMGKGDVAILHDECVPRAGTLDPARADGPIVTTFGLANGSDYRFGGKRVWLRAGRRLEPVPGPLSRGTRKAETKQGSVGFENTLFANDVLGLTAAAAVSVIEACGEDPAVVAKAARTFEPLPHRMQHVASIRGVAFVNDSKATNLAAVRAALQMSSDRVALIAGGMLKETDLRLEEKWIIRKLKAVYLIGRDARKMQEAWGRQVTCRLCGSLEEAVRAAWQERKRVDTVLLSPGGASFDQFEDFEDRGRQFTRIVSQLKTEEDKR
jgi:UDP-N-acetylmuramoylalanine--D-glutamate ligase